MPLARRDRPAAAIVEPITPPMSACDELDGIPNSQVSRFQMIPPARPAATTVSVTSLVLTRPLAIVAATASDRKAPTRLRTPDKATATRGSSALVAIEVAIALPVSWNPLVKSKAESGDDHQHEDRCVTHANRVPSAGHAVEIRRKQLSDCNLLISKC